MKRKVFLPRSIRSGPISGAGAEENGTAGLAGGLVILGIALVVFAPFTYAFARKVL